MIIQPMELSDTFSLHELRPEGWADVSEHFRHNVLSPLCDPIKVVIDGKIVGVGSSIANEDTAWLASIIVRPEYRNRGIGSAITQALLSRLDKRFETILLDATEYGYPIYKKAGFEVISEHLHFTGEPLHDVALSPFIVHYEEKYRDGIFALDRQATGENRSAYLAEHLAGAYVYVYHDEIKGICFPNLIKGMAIASTPEAGIGLMKLRLKERDTCMVPVENIAAIDFLQSIGFRQTGTSRRMRLGKARGWRGDYIYNTISGARG